MAEIRCWDCKGQFQPEIVREGNDLIAVCPNCSTKHVLAHMKEGSQQIEVSWAIREDGKKIFPSEPRP
jgi:Zn finger protein HypA/HybF involved in hydrogenase expression